MPDYPYIRAWGWMLGSQPEHVDGVLRLARQTSAPETALHDTAEGWATYADITAEETRQLVRSYVAAVLRRGY